MRITIHQPEHAPWLGLLDKVRKSDYFVILDTVQFKKNDFQNRNKLRSGWITVPVKGHPLATDIKDIEIANVDWKNGYLARFKTYQFESRYEKYFPKIEQLIQSSTGDLSVLNTNILFYLMDCFDIYTPTIHASSLGLPQVRGGHDVVMQICRHFEADSYLSGIGGRNYLRLEDFKKEGIDVEFNDVDYPKLSSFDYLFTNGTSF